MKKINTRAFTLIEIMIVIAIISLLAVTLVPKLTGAQARSRDASRTSSLAQMKAVLTAYYDDYAEYPKNTHGSGSSDDGDYCLSEDGKGTLSSNSALKDYVENGKTSFDPQKTAKVGGCNTPGSLGYIALAKNGNNNSAFVLSAQTETYQKSNTKYSSGTIDENGSSDIDNIVGASKPFDNSVDISDLKTADASDEKSTIYTIVGG